MDSGEEIIPVYDENAEESAEPAAHHGADLQHIAAVLADPNPSSGQLQGRKMAKKFKWRPEPSGSRRVRSGQESALPGRRVSTEITLYPTDSPRASKMAEVPAHAFQDKGKQWLQPSTGATTAGPTKHHSSLGFKAGARRSPHQAKAYSSEAGPSMQDAESSDSDWEEEQDQAAQRAGRSRAYSGTGPSSSEAPSAAHTARHSSHQHPRGRLKHDQSQASSEHPFFDRPGLQKTPEAAFCEACACWVPSEPNLQDKRWKEHLRSKRHAREVALRLREEATRQSTQHYRSNVLPAMKHAAEELRCLGVSGAEGAGPSLRQAARSANEVLRANDRTSQQISKLHADAMRELVHHTGGSGDFQRMATRLSRERLACAWPVMAAKEANPANNTLMVLGATPATLACLAGQLPEMQATTVVISLASMHASDLAPTTAALCLLARALAAGNSLRRLQVSLLGVRASAAASAAPAEHAAERDARLIGRVISELNRTVAINCSLRLLSLRVLEPRLVAREWAEVQATAAHAAPRLRGAVAAALHPRVDGACPLRWLPLHIFKEILDLALPITPCKVVLR